MYTRACFGSLVKHAPLYNIVPLQTRYIFKAYPLPVIAKEEILLSLVKRTVRRNRQIFYLFNGFFSNRSFVGSSIELREFKGLKGVAFFCYKSFCNRWLISVKSSFELLVNFFSALLAIL